MNILLSLVISLASTLAFAGEALNFEQIGFSADGKHFAYMQSGELDGSGAFFAQIDVIDVDNNKLLVRVSDSVETLEIPIGMDVPSPQELVEGLYQEADLGAYGIDVKNLNKGELVINRPNNDLSQYTDAVFSTWYWPEGGASAPVPSYSLTVKEMVASNANEHDWCYDDPMMIKLVMVHDMGYSGVVSQKVLQEDQRLPKSRACAYDYEIRHVVVYGQKMVVGLRYSHPGFEGPSQTFMAVTGTLEM